MTNSKVHRVALANAGDDELEAVEDRDSIRAFEEAKASCEEPVPFEEAILDIEASREGDSG